MPEELIPVSIITGFLGSGKTTLLNCLVRDQRFGDALVVINEFGEVGIDHLIVAAPTERVRLLSNGCLCCEVRGELVETIREAIEARRGGRVGNFRQIVIETTGLADPAPLVRAIVQDDVLARYLRLDLIVCVVDCVNAPNQLESEDEATRQIAIADVVLLSKVDLAQDDEVADVRERALRLNPLAHVDRVVHGQVHPAVFERKSRIVETARLTTWHCGTDTGRAYPHAHDVVTFTLIHEGAITKTGLSAWLAILCGLRGARLLRVKGIVNVEGSPVLIHGTQSVIHDVEWLTAWPSSDNRTRLVFIGRSLDRDAVNASFLEAVQMDVKADAPIDAEQYRRFVASATRLVGAVSVE